jgi:hypothetical protein
MAVNLIPDVGDNAFENGFLNKQYAQRLVSLQNRVWIVKIPAGSGTGKVIESEQNVVIDLTSSFPLNESVDIWVNGQRMVMTVHGTVFPPT